MTDDRVAEIRSYIEYACAVLEEMSDPIPAPIQKTLTVAKRDDPDQIPTIELCRARVVFGGAIFVCSLEKDHDGDHISAETGATWTR